MINQEAQREKERQFICPCSKSYFSYAALFTHIKQKHDGKPPGQIIKPKAENKRGRPRKKPLPSHSSASSVSQPNRRAFPRGQDMWQQLQINSVTDLNQKIFDIRGHSSSKFTLYKRDHNKIATTCDFFLQNSFEDELLKDLSRYLQIREVSSVPEEILFKISASLYLIQKGEGQSLVVDSMRRFLNFCLSGLRQQTYSQLFLLLSMLLQHIMQVQKCQNAEAISIGSIHEHIVSFFSYIDKKSEEIDLRPFIIFNDLNTIKTLIVYFNWLSKMEISDSTTKEEESCSQE